MIYNIDNNFFYYEESKKLNLQFLWDHLELLTTHMFLPLFKWLPSEQTAEMFSYDEELCISNADTIKKRNLNFATLTSIKHKGIPHDFIQIMLEDNFYDYYCLDISKSRYVCWLKYFKHWPSIFSPFDILDIISSIHTATSFLADHKYELTNCEQLILFYDMNWCINPSSILPQTQTSSVSKNLVYLLNTLKIMLRHVEWPKFYKFKTIHEKEIVFYKNTLLETLEYCYTYQHLSLNSFIKEIEDFVDEWQHSTLFNSRAFMLLKKQFMCELEDDTALFLSEWFSIAD